MIKRILNNTSIEQLGGKDILDNIVDSYTMSAEDLNELFFYRNSLEHILYVANSNTSYSIILRKEDIVLFHLDKKLDKIPYNNKSIEPLIERLELLEIDGYVYKLLQFLDTRKK